MTPIPMVESLTTAANLTAGMKRMPFISRLFTEAATLITAQAAELETVKKERDVARSERDNLGESLRDCSHYRGIAEKDATAAETECLRLREALETMTGSRDGYSKIAEVRANHSDQWKKRSQELETALTEFMQITEPAAQPAFVDPDYGDDVERLGERIGYGALISSASASWRESAERNGNPTGGEFVVGPCYSVLMHARERARSALQQGER